MSCGSGVAKKCTESTLRFIPGKVMMDPGAEICTAVSAKGLMEAMR